MCGIAGLIDFSQSLGPERLRAIATDMADALVHRGPEDFGVWVDPTGYCALSVRCLSIIDTSPAGHQPMLAPDGKACITFNGEIYNVEQLRSILEGKGCSFRTHTDTEVLLAAVGRYGDEVYEALDGMYAFCLFRRRFARARPRSRDSARNRAVRREAPTRGSPIAIHPTATISTAASHR
jgi:asparagine synthase (glutamine-hydrolysing)